MNLSERLVLSDGVREGDQVCGRGICTCQSASCYQMV